MGNAPGAGALKFLVFALHNGVVTQRNVAVIVAAVIVAIAVVIPAVIPLLVKSLVPGKERTIPVVVIPRYAVAEIYMGLFQAGVAVMVATQVVIQIAHAMSRILIVLENQNSSKVNLPGMIPQALQRLARQSRFYRPQVMISLESNRKLGFWHKD